MAIMNAFKKQHGFTIVELLIVIIVVGILAAITVVSYNSTQQRARDARMVATVTQYKDLLKLYKVNKGTYPSPANTTYTACLGNNYPAAPNFPTNSCIAGGASSSVDTTLNNELRKIGGQLPEPNDFAASTFFSLHVRGLMYSVHESNPSILYYYSKPNKCPIGDIQESYNNTTFCALVLEQ